MKSYLWACNYLPTRAQLSCQTPTCLLIFPALFFIPCFAVRSLSSLLAPSAEDRSLPYVSPSPEEDLYLLPASCLSPQKFVWSCPLHLWRNLVLPLLLYFQHLYSASLPAVFLSLPRLCWRPLIFAPPSSCCFQEPSQIKPYSRCWNTLTIVMVCPISSLYRKQTLKSQKKASLFFLYFWLRLEVECQKSTVANLLYREVSCSSLHWESSSALSLGDLYLNLEESKVASSRKHWKFCVQHKWISKAIAGIWVQQVICLVTKGNWSTKRVLIFRQWLACNERLFHRSFDNIILQNILQVTLHFCHQILQRAFYRDSMDADVRFEWTQVAVSQI